MAAMDAVACLGNKSPVDTGGTHFQCGTDCRRATYVRKLEAGVLRSPVRNVPDDRLPLRAELICIEKRFQVGSGTCRRLGSRSDGSDRGGL